jgi:hypothetical protein
MDLNPDEAIAAGWLRPNSWSARVLEGMSRFSLRQADKVIALDRFMKQKIEEKGHKEKVVIIPPWSHEEEVRFDAAGRERFRKAHGLEEKFVVMYSGNHSPCHPLYTLLAAAARLVGDWSIAFCFIGGGSEWRRIGGTVGRCASTPVRRFVGRTELGGRRAEDGEQCDGTQRETLADRRTGAPILLLPYQPLEHLSASLSAADLHVVIMGEQFVGLVHPCKIYNILAVGAPVLYIGPERSHVTEIFGAEGGESVRRCVGASVGQGDCKTVGRCESAGDGAGEEAIAVAAHGEVEKVVEHILRMKQARRRFNYDELHGQFAKGVALPRLVAVLDGEQMD